MRYSSTYNPIYIQQRKFYLFITGGIAAVWLWILYTLQAGVAQGFSPCIFKAVTGISCPSCGITRGIIALLQGHFSAPMHLNLLTYLAVPALAAIPIWLLADAVSGRPVMHRAYTSALQISKRHPAILISFFSVITANWIWILYNHSI